MGKSEVPLDQVFRFEGFTLDAGRRELRRGAATVDLRPKCLDVLTCLLRRAGQVVTKNELMEQVWPDVVVTDESLTRCVSDIRQALGDAGQAIIKTVPRRGYVLVSVVVSETPMPAEWAAAVEPTRPAHLPTTSIAKPVGQRASHWSLGALGVAGALVLVIAGYSAARFVGAPSATGAPSLSIVVLPLVNLGGDREQDYFAEGLTEDLSTDLSRIPQSLVIARSSAQAYKGQPVDARRIGRELGVRYLLEGSVQRLGDQVRLNLRLIDAESARELWADRIDGSRTDLAALQTSVTGVIARTLHLQLAEAEAQHALRVRPVNPDARDLAWQAWSALEQRTLESVATARQLLQRAVAMDATSAFAWSLLSETYTTDLLMRWLSRRDGATRDAWLSQARMAADRANAIDPNNLYALGAMGAVLQVSGEPERALAMLSRQVEVNRNYAPAWHKISYTQATLGRPEEAIRAGDEALRLSPRDGRLYSFLVVTAAAHLYAGRDREALVWARRSIDARSDFSISHAWAAAAAANLNEMDTAKKEIGEFQRLQPDYTVENFRREGQSRNPDFLRQRERFYAGLRRAGLPE
ncbi:MAG: winged helix-turn-helix domain-containing protein [Burkholderiaceae bacterium]